MKPHSDRRFARLRRRVSVLAAAAFLICPAAALAQHYQETILVANAPGLGAKTVDPSLVDPWGIARSTTSPWWVADRAAGVATVYRADGTKLSTTVAFPGTPEAAAGSPTGIVYNGSSDFSLMPGMPARFIFVSLNGTISGWTATVNPAAAVAVIPGSSVSVLTGVTTATIGRRRLLYVADLRQARIAVYDAFFQPISLGPQAFHDASIPTGFAPFNVQNIGNLLYVAYAQQNADKSFVNFGAGLGYVDVFSPKGRLLNQLQYGDWFDAPWGLALAPTDFGSFSHDLLVGQFGSGEILAFDPITDRFEGKLRDPNGNPITLPGLWGLSFGAGQPSPQSSGLANSLFFNAGINQGNGGLFGTLTPVVSELIQGNDQ